MNPKTYEFNPLLEEELRTRAEAQFALAEASNKPVWVHVATELLNELHVQQKELQMQYQELLRTQAALEVSHSYYVELYDFAPVGYLTLNAKGMIAKINLTAAKLLGMDRKLLINRRFEQFVADDYKAHWQQYCLHAMQEEGNKYCELALHNKGSTALYVRLDCMCINSVDAGIQMRVMLSDITQNKQAEEKQRIAAVAFETQDGIIVTDANKLILQVNQAFSRITGYSAEAAIGKPPALLNSDLHDEDFYRALWASVANNGYWQGEIWTKQKNGEVFPIWLTITAVTDAEDLITHFVGAFTDITAQKQAERILLDARERLENQVVTNKEELQKVKTETVEVNSALNILLKHRETDKSEAQIALSQGVAETILPFLKLLKAADTGRIQSTRLVDIIENNLNQLTKSFGSAENNLPSVYLQLTRVEIQVASLVRQGLSTKAIATTLNLSSETINNHRKHIRKKLKLDGKANNLHSYLLSLTE